MTAQHANTLKDGDFIATEDNIENLQERMEEEHELLRTALLNIEYNGEEMTAPQFKRAVQKAAEIIEENTPKWKGFEAVDLWIYPESINEENYKVSIDFSFEHAEGRGHEGVFSFQVPEMSFDSISSFNDTNVWLKQIHRNQRYDFEFSRYDGDL